MRTEEEILRYKTMLEQGKIAASSNEDKTQEAYALGSLHTIEWIYRNGAEDMPKECGICGSEVQDLGHLPEQPK